MTEIEEETFKVTISKCAETGQRLSQVWRNMKTGKIDNPYGPAETVYHRDEQIPEKLVYWKDGKVSREDGPSIIAYDEQGKLVQETNVVNAKLHALGMPSSKFFDSSGEVREAHYHRDGKRILRVMVASPN